MEMRYSEREAQHRQEGRIYLGDGKVANEACGLAV